jgi:thiamine-monophosphate kinase
MRDGAEFRRIKSFIASADTAPAPGVVVGPGDDAAVLNLAEGESVVFSTDLSIEGVHFRREWMTWRTVGYRATAAALSDLAAMAAHPVGVAISLAVPPELDEGVDSEIAAGAGECLREQGATLLGGDLSRSPGPVAIDVSAVGRVAAPVERIGALAGDELWLTGDLGGAGAAVAALSTGLEPDPRARRRLERPRARTAEAVWLAERTEIHAMIDLSDGLAADAQHLSAASGIRLEIFSDDIPLHPVLSEWASVEAALAVACGGGEDYELLFAVSPAGLDELVGEFERRFDVRLSRVGRVTRGSGVAWLDRSGRPGRAPAAGFDHFEVET